MLLEESNKKQHVWGKLLFWRIVPCRLLKHALPLILWECCQNSFSTVMHLQIKLPKPYSTKCLNGLLKRKYSALKVLGMGGIFLAVVGWLTPQLYSCYWLQKQQFHFQFLIYLRARRMTWIFLEIGAWGKEAAVFFKRTKPNLPFGVRKNKLLTL